MSSDTASPAQQAGSTPPSARGALAGAAASPLDAPPRVSQRASNSCAFCTKRKIKCNKAIPCDNCIRRGHPETCTRLPAIVRGRLVNAPSTATRAPLTPDQIRLLREGQLQRENVNLRRKVNELEGKLRELEQGVGSSPSAAAKPGMPPGVATSTPGSVGGGSLSVDGNSPSNAFASLLGAAREAAGEKAARVERSRQDDPDVLEPFVHVMAHPAVQHQRPSSPHPRRRELDSPAPMSPMGGLPDLPSRNATDLRQADLITLLPSAPQSMLIVRASLKYMSFLHCTVHVPIWLAEHDDWMTGINEGREIEKSDAWLSYYFAILSVGMYFAGDLLAPELGLSMDETSSLSSFWFDVSLEALNRSKFMSTNPTMEALQTIVVLPMVSYNFGASAHTESLLHVGLRLAQLLKLHLLGPEPDDTHELPPGLIDREVGRRVWLLLRLGEGRPDFANTGGLRLPQGMTVEPFNANYEDFTDTSVFARPLAEFTIVTHLLCAGRRYRIFRQFAEAFADANSLKDQYLIAMAADQALQANFADFTCLHGSDNDTFEEHFDLHGPHDHRPHSRYMWTLLMPSGTILVYRSFLGRAYNDERFTEIRETCLTAAREILRQRQRRVPPMFLRSWPIASYTVLAGVVLSTELVHGSPTPAMREQLVGEIQGLIDSLWECGTNSLVVQRGTTLLRRFIDSSEKSAAAQALAQGRREGSVPFGAGADAAGAAPMLKAGGAFTLGAADAAPPQAPAVPAVQELWPSLPVPVDGSADVWSMNNSEDVWSNALVALENDEASGWWTTLL